MDIDRRQHRRMRAQNRMFVILFVIVLGLLGWLSTRYHYQSDWTASGRNTLATASSRLLEQMPGPILITAFARESDVLPLRHHIRELVGRYQRAKGDVRLSFVDPDERPDQARAAGISGDGELIVEYGGRRESVKSADEQTLTNALNRLARSGERHIFFLAGHGERRPDAAGDRDFGDWTAPLSAKGFRFDMLNLAVDAQIPEETTALVIADPQSALLPGEAAMVADYVARGGNLLWLVEPGAYQSLGGIASRLGVTPAPGTIVDLTGRLLGVSNPAVVVVAQYPQHPVTDGLTGATLLPLARPLLVEAKGWKSTVILRTLDRSWAETGSLEGSVGFDQGKDLPGPLAVGVALSRTVPGSSGQPSRNQRVVVIGNADFLSNHFLGGGANRELGDRLLNWLSQDDAFITIPPREVPDRTLILDKWTGAAIGFGFLFILPGALVAAGFGIAWRRRRR